MKDEKIRRLLGLGARARSLVIGSRETRAALRRGRVSLVLLAGDGSVRDRERLLRLAGEEGVPVSTLAADAAELGQWVGRGRVSVLGIEDPNLASAIRQAASREPAGGAQENHGPEEGPSKRGGK
jgi:ribosomal protein L7Ae-like RNA K-turn-binding protein